MHRLRFDSVGGASGDMLLAALAGLGADEDTVRRALASLDVEPFDLVFEPVKESGLRGLRADVRVRRAASSHRHLQQIRDLIDRSQLPPAAKQMSVKVFEALAAAEGAVHGTEPERVHFHEVGAVDSIVDIAGCCTAFALLEVEGVTVTPLPLGQGTVATAHGRIPVPAPATVELLKGLPVTHTGEDAELVTPTAAALLTTWRAACAGRRADGPEEIVRASTAFGHRRLTGRPNLLRVLLTRPAAAQPVVDECVVLECNLDDTVPELVGSLCSRALEEGALDAYTTPVQMKKQRPGVVFTVLARAADRSRFLDLLFAETTTFGIREYGVRRTKLDRRHVDAVTPYGTVRVKVGTWRGRVLTRAPEHDDCVRRAREHGVPVRAVYEAALAAGYSAS